MLSGLTGGSGMSEMLSSVMGSISNNTQSSESPNLDIGQLMTTMGPLMSQMMGGDLSQLMGQMNMENKEQDESY
jgi:hypothetical protein